MVSSTAAAEKELQGMVLRCDQTGKLFFSHREAEVHGEETGFQAFSQVSLEETATGSLPSSSCSQPSPS